MSDCYEDELMEFAYQENDNPDQEEANFYFALHEFKEIVAKHGVSKVLSELDKDTEAKLYWYYFNADDNDTPPF